MKIALSIMLGGVMAVAGAVGTAQAADEHTIVTAPDIKWGPAPPSVPPGAQVAVLYGDPAKDGLFAMRLKLPKAKRK